MANSRRALAIGSAIGLLNIVIANSQVSNRGVGASTSYPWVADFIFKLQASTYFSEIDTAGSWEVLFLAGAFMGALVGAVATGRFRVRFVPELWANLKGPSVFRRLAWSFVGGFVLIFGARLADGCTSGHILSGGMELAVSSFVFAIFVFLSVTYSARRFYGRANG